jgi:hypothetical protein
MSTKNLARTVIEGGRTGHSKYLRRRSLRYWRRDNRRLCKALGDDIDAWGEAELPIRERFWEDISHADRVNPCERFLISRAGRPWNEVRSEICHRFDRRKLAGMHVTNDHLLNRVQVDYESYAIRYWWRSGGPKFWVTDDGILRHNPKARW